MLVVAGTNSSRLNFWRRGTWISLAVLVLSVLSLSPYFVSSTEVVRMRNALALMDGANTTFDWTPENVPADFMLERGTPDPQFVEAAAKLGLADMSSDWDRVLAISRHLLGSAPELVGSPIQSDLRDTYDRITHQGQGYCVDFTRVFMAFAVTAGIPVRSWAFSFDGFGGHGHVLPEIWNRQLKRWQLVDVFNNYYFHGADGVAVSASELRRALREAPLSIHVDLLYPGARPGYVIEEKLWDYYGRGLPEWYMFWGNNVFSYDRAMMARPLGRVSRSLEQLDAIAIGIYPPVNLVVDSGNRDKVDAMWRLRRHLIVVAWTGGLALLVLPVCAVGWQMSTRRRLPLEPT